MKNFLNGVLFELVNVTIAAIILWLAIYFVGDLSSSFLGCASIVAFLRIMTSDFIYDSSKK